MDILFLCNTFYLYTFYLRASMSKLYALIHVLQSQVLPRNQLPSISGQETLRSKSPTYEVCVKL